MRVRASVKALCRNCKVVRRRGVVRIICTDPAFLGIEKNRTNC